MQRLIDFILRFKDQFLLLALGLIAFYLISTNNNPQLNSIRTTAFNSFASLENYLTFFSKYIDAVDEAQQLRNQNMKLSEEVYRLRSNRLENIQLRSYLKLNNQIEFSGHVADIISKSIFRSNNHYTLNIGSSDGIEIDDAVITPIGVVGRIILVGEKYSVAELMISDNFRMAAKLQKSNTEGIIKWDASDIDHVLLTNIVQTTPVSLGEPVVTSAYSTFIPSGISIGIVDSVYKETSNIFLKIRVKTSVNFSTIGFVYVTHAKNDQNLTTFESVIKQK